MSGTNTISAQWSNVIGNSTVRVVETNSNGCIGDTMTQTVLLPVNLLTFTAKPSNNDGLLNWATSSEMNNRGFEVQRSLDGKTIAYFSFVNGFGNTSTFHH